MAHIPPDKLSQMRKRAEEHLARIVEHSLPQLAPHDVQTLVHELRVNQVELALQCDELERAQAEAEESRNEYRELYESIPIGYATVDAKGCLEDLNPAGIELLGLATTAMPSKSFTSYIEPDDADRFTLFCRTVVGSQGRQTGEFMMKRADGGAFVALLQAVAVRSDKGQGEQLRILFKDITSRKQAEEALLRHEAELVAARHLAEASATGAIERESKTARELLVNRLRLDSIIQSAMDAILTVDSRQQILLFNRAAELMFKCPAREAIGQPLDRFIPARFRQDHRRHVEGFGRSGVTSRRMGQLGTVTGLRTDGEEFPLEAAISHVMVEGQRYYTVILRDVSDRKRVEEALRESTERLSLLIKYAPAALAMLDRNMRFLAVSERWMADYGLGERNIVGQYHYEVFSETPDRWKEAYRRGLAGEVIREEEDLWTRADGSQLWLRWEVRPWHAADGSVGGIVIFSEDITDRKQAERLVRQSEERYRRLIAVSPYAVLVHRDGHIIFANDQAIKLFGAVRAEEILGKSPFELFHPDDHAAIRQHLRELTDGRAEVPMAEERIITLDGTPVEVEISAARFADEEGPAALVMLRDASERKRLQEQLRRTERIAELGTLASGMAHEIGTPMNVILGRAEYLMDRVPDEPTKKGLQTIITQVERITRVMNQLLAFARRKPPERAPLWLKEIIENSVEMFQERLTRARVNLVLELEDGCPKALADADQMSQVLINLIMNALHAMPEGGTLRIGLRRAADRVEVMVADTGHGIPPEALARIFEPFFTTKEFGKGTGLGLTVVKGIIEEHHGSISVVSAPGTGTTFTMTLPCSREA